MIEMETKLQQSLALIPWLASVQEANPQRIRETLRAEEWAALREVLEKVRHCQTKAPKRSKDTSWPLWMKLQMTNQCWPKSILLNLIRNITKSFTWKTKCKVVAAYFEYYLTLSNIKSHKSLFCFSHFCLVFLFSKGILVATIWVNVLFLVR